MNKKLWIIMIAVLLLAGVITVYAAAVHVPGNADDHGINTYQLSAENAEEIRDIFDGKRLYFDSPACGFDGDTVAIGVGGATFLPALDSCGTVQYGLRYFSLSESEKRTVKKILVKYGVRCFSGY